MRVLKHPVTLIALGVVIGLAAGSRIRSLPVIGKAANKIPQV